MIERIIEDGRPISHVADEAGISRQRLTVWLRRYEMFGDAGLEDRSSRPARSPNQTSEELEDRIEQLRRTTKFGPDRISGELALEGVTISPATVHRVLVRRGINRRTIRSSAEVTTDHRLLRPRPSRGTHPPQTQSADARSGTQAGPTRSIERRIWTRSTARSQCSGPSHGATVR